MPRRGFLMVFSILGLGWVNCYLTTPQISFVGRFAGGWFIYAISVMDAYRWVRYRWSTFGAGASTALAAQGGEISGAGSRSYWLSLPCGPIGAATGEACRLQQLIKGAGND